MLLRQSSPEFDFQPGHYRIFYTLSKSSMFAPWPESSPPLAPFPSVPAPVFPARRKNRDAKISRPSLPPPPSRYPSSCLDRSPMPCRAASCIAKRRRGGRRRMQTRTLAFARRSRVCRLRRMQRARPGQERHICFSFHFFLLNRINHEVNVLAEKRSISKYQVPSCHRRSTNGGRGSRG